MKLLANEGIAIRLHLYNLTPRVLFKRCLIYHMRDYDDICVLLHINYFTNGLATDAQRKVQVYNIWTKSRRKYRVYGQVTSHTP